MGRQNFLFDRRSKSCCRPWTFRSGEVWTTISFNQPLTRPLGPWDPTFPSAYAQHLHWIMTYHMKTSFARPDHSYYMAEVYKPTGSKGYHVTVGDNVQLCADSPQCRVAHGSELSGQFAARHWPDGKYDAYYHDPPLENAARPLRDVS